jgi:Ca-activated chloride channel family protein
MMPYRHMPFPVQPSSDPSCGGRLEHVDPKALPLRDVKIAASAGGGMARVVLHQRFHNPHAEPLSVSYLFPLPEGAAVSGYAFTIGDRRIVGEVDNKAVARERFEQAIADGRSAALVEQERSSLFTQEIGNIPPGADVVAEITLDQPLRWLDEGHWEWRFPLASAPRYLGAPGRVADAPRVTHSVADQEIGVRASLELRVRDAITAGRKPDSPSHAMRTTDEGAACAVRFGEEAGAALDRDVVVRWAVATAKPGVSLDVMRHLSEGFGLLTLVPPSPVARHARVPRDLIVLLDTSGSMGGAPLDQARRVTSALVDTLREIDQLELIEFGSRARRWNKGSVAATPGNKKDALAWLASLKAGGSTEMRDAIEEGMSGLRAESQRQVVLITDGQIGFESEVVAAILSRLPAASRVHTVGVGSAVNRSLTGPAARAGRGVEVVIGLGEDPERAAARIVARTDAPLVVDVSLEGSALLEHAPSRLPDLFAGAPVLVGAKLRAEGGDLVVRGRTATGAWVEHLRVSPVENGKGDAGVRALFGREHVEDLEMQVAAGGDVAKLDLAIERVGLRFQIATRLTSWVAVTEERTVDPRDPTRRVRVPQNLPHGMSIEGLGLRGAIPSAGSGVVMLGELAAEEVMQTRSVGAVTFAKGRSEFLGGAVPRRAGAPMPVPQAPPPAEAPHRTLMERAVGAARALVGGTGGAPPAGTAQLTERHLKGRVVTHKGREVTLEVTVEDMDLVWAPHDAEVFFAGGQSVRASIVTERTTRDGTIAVGATLRIVLELPTVSAVDPKTVRITMGGIPLIIFL